MNSFRTCTTSLYLGSSVRRLFVILMLLAWSKMDAGSDIVKNNQNNNINNKLERTVHSGSYDLAKRMYFTGFSGIKDPGRTGQKM